MLLLYFQSLCYPYDNRTNQNQNDAKIQGCTVRTKSIGYQTTNAWSYDAGKTVGKKDQRI